MSWHVKKRDRPLAAVYRGPIACDGCAESVYRLLEGSPANFQVTYLGPREARDVTADNLRGLALFAWPGGGDDVGTDYRRVSNYTQPLQDFVRNGGLYAGFCLGAYLARGSGRNQAFFGLLPEGSSVASEAGVSGGQIRGSQDTVAQVDWTFGSGSRRGQRDRNRWMYFQDSGRIILDNTTAGNSTVLGRYSYTNNTAAAIIPYGAGFAGLVGTHPEAEQNWYSGARISNPDGVRMDLGYDFVQTLYASQSSQTNTSTPTTTTGTGATSAATAAIALGQGTAQLSSILLLLVIAMGLLR